MLLVPIVMKSVSRLLYEVEEQAVGGTQEVRTEIPNDAGCAYRHIFVPVREVPLISASGNL